VAFPTRAPRPAPSKAVGVGVLAVSGGTVPTFRQLGGGGARSATSARPEFHPALWQQRCFVSPCNKQARSQLGTAQMPSPSGGN
jgi:hypothetical protein